DIAHHPDRMVTELGRGQERQRGECRNRKGDDDLRARRLQGGNLRPDVGVGRNIVLATGDRRRAQLRIEALDAIEPEFVVLVEVSDLLAAETLRDVLAEDLALDG